MSFFYLFLVYLLVPDVVESDCESNWPSCASRGLNTVCVRGGDCSPTGSCEDLSGWQDFRRWMTEKHNELRSNLALGKDTTGGNSAASDMNAISYDLDLEYVAQCHINRCDFNHDKCRLTTKFSKTVGQNLYTGTHKLTDEESIKHIVQTWYDEIKDIQAGVIDSFKSTDPATGHFTQVVWAATTEIGCGMSKSGATYYVAFNYGVGGNMLGAKIYTRGPACSQCKNGLKCNSDYPGLCGEITIASGESLSVISKFYYTLLSIAVIMLS